MCWNTFNVNLNKVIWGQLIFNLVPRAISAFTMATERRLEHPDEREIAILAIREDLGDEVGLCCMGADGGRVPRMTNMLENEKKTRRLGNR